MRIRFDDGRKKEELPLWERRQRFIQAKKFLYNRAVTARSKASSWRDFHVGTALLTFRSGWLHEDSWSVFTGMNIKHAENMRPTCSEPIAVGATIMEGYDLIVGMVVVGQHREEDIGVTKTLHPCRDCRHLLYGYLYEDDPMLQVVDEQTIIHNAMAPEHGGNAINEEYTLAELLTYHRSKDLFE